MSVTSGKSVTLSKALSDEAAGGTNYTAAGTLYLALFSVAIVNGDPSTGTEATGSGYARVTITNNTTNFPAGSGATTPITKSLHVAFSFGAATGDWSASANMVGWGLFDDLTLSTAHLLYYGPITTPLNVLNGDIVTFPIDSITWTEQ